MESIKKIEDTTRYAETYKGYFKSLKSAVSAHFMDTSAVGGVMFNLLEDVVAGSGTVNNIHERRMIPEKLSLLINTVDIDKPVRVGFVLRFYLFQYLGVGIPSVSDIWNSNGVYGAPQHDKLSQIKELKDTGAVVVDRQFGESFLLEIIVPKYMMENIEWTFDDESGVSIVKNALLLIVQEQHITEEEGEIEKSVSFELLFKD